MRKIIIVLTFLFSLLSAEEEYELGNGAQVESFPLYLGGYFSVDYSSMESEERYRLNNLALMAYGGMGNFSYMAEFEYKNLYVETRYANDLVVTQEDRVVHLERLYLDYNYNDVFMLRVGKFNSPIGFWNLLPVNALRQTTSNPVSANIVFPRFTTGANVSFVEYSESEIRIDVMIQNDEDADDEYNNYEIDEHYGLNVLYEKENFALKANAGYFHKIETYGGPETFSYWLLSAKYETDDYQLMGEVGYQESEEGVTTPYAGYLQALYRITEKHVPSVRYESYEDRLKNVSDEITTFAYTYRPEYPIAIKTEYQDHSLDAFDKVIFSLSVIF